VSRQTRPVRRVRGPERAALADRLWPGRSAAPLYEVRVAARWPSTLTRAAGRLGVRRSVLRRVLLGREVSAKAAARVLRAWRT
jgi:hypothetical protein